MKVSDSDRERQYKNMEEVARHLQAGQQDQPVAMESGKNQSRRFAKTGGVGMLLLFAFSKLKFLAVGLKLMKFSSILTMILSMWAYSTIFGWPFSVGFVLLIVVHELGHGIVMRMFGIPASAPTFIPFVGAVIAMKGRPRNAYVEAMVAFGGPVLGSAAALVCLLIALAVGSDFWMALAYSGFMINLFNLLPISPLDGGRIVGAFNRKLWILGFAIGIPMFLVSHSPILLLILVVGLFGLMGRRNEPEGYFDIPPRTKQKLALGYFGLAAILAYGVSISHVQTGL